MHTAQRHFTVQVPATRSYCIEVMTDNVFAGAGGDTAGFEVERAMVFIVYAGLMHLICNLSAYPGRPCEYRPRHFHQLAAVRVLVHRKSSEHILGR